MPEAEHSLHRIVWLLEVLTAEQRAFDGACFMFFLGLTVRSNFAIADLE